MSAAGVKLVRNIILKILNILEAKDQEESTQYIMWVSGRVEISVRM